MTTRKIRLSLLGLSGIVYRFFVIAIHVLFIWIVTGHPKLVFSLGWGAVNLGCYYLYHYIVLRHFKFGKD